MLFLHVGLPKTGTTFMQNVVFPKWRGVTYLVSGNFEHLLLMEEGERYLISREGLLKSHNFSLQETRARRMARLSKIFPEARILISFRRHAAFIVSCYRQYLQKGGRHTFEKYFDVDGDGGVLRREEFLFRRELESIDDSFRHKPFVFCQEEIKENLPNLLRDLEAFMGGEAPDPESLRFKAHNKSVGYYPAKLLRRINMLTRSPLNPSGRLDLYSRRLSRLNLDPKSLCQYGLSFLPDRPFISDELRGRIDSFYADDWDYIQSRVRARLESNQDFAHESAVHARL